MPLPATRSRRGKWRSPDHAPSLDDFRNVANPLSLRSGEGGSSGPGWSRYHRWNFEWTPAEISAILSAAYGQQVGIIHEINLLEHGPSGRVMQMEFVTDAGRFYQNEGSHPFGTGASYDEILKHYSQGIDLATWKQARRSSITN